MSRDAMERQMERALGWGEPGNPAQVWYAKRNGQEFWAAPWCDILITWAAFKSGNYKAVCYGKDYAYTVWHAQAAQRNGDWHYGYRGIRRGDIVFIQWEGGKSDIGRIDHVGYVVSAVGSNIETIEGNTADRCARRVRRKDSRITGYLRPKYKGDDDVSAEEVWEWDGLPAPRTASTIETNPTWKASSYFRDNNERIRHLQKAVKNQDEKIDNLTALVGQLLERLSE